MTSLLNASANVASANRSMRIIAVVSQKGGVGKTVTTSNLAVVCAEAGLRVLMIDLDPQHHLSVHWRISERGVENVFECDVPAPIPTCIENVDLMPGNRRLQGLENNLYATRDLVRLWGVMQQKIRPLGYDVVLIDCPPNLDGCTENAIVAAHSILIPMVMSPNNLATLADTVALIAKLRGEVPARYGKVTEDIVGVATVYKDRPVQRRTLERAKAHPTLRGIVEWCNTKIRVSTLYETAEEKNLPATAVGGKASYPVVDHEGLAREIGLFDVAVARTAPAGATQ